MPHNCAELKRGHDRPMTSSSAPAITGSPAPPISARPAEGEGGRAPPGGRRRRGDGGIPSGLSQLGRGLHGQPAQSQGDPRPRAARPRAAHRRAPRAEFSARRRRPLSARPARAAPGHRRQVQRRATPHAIDAFTRELDAIADVLRDLVLQAAAQCRRRLGSAQHQRSRQRRAARAGRLRRLVAGAARVCSICSPNRPAISRRAGSRATPSRRCSASTPWSAITPARTRRARPT